MRVAIFSDNFYPELGGIQDSILSLGKELARNGHSVAFFVPAASSADYRLAHLPEGELNLGKNISIYRLASFPYPSPTKQSRFVMPTGFRFLALKKFNPDVIHTQTFFGVGVEALLAAKILKVPLVGTNHWAITEFGHYSPFRLDSYKYYSLKLVSWYYDQCDFVTAPSESVFTEMKKVGFYQSHQALSNPIETDIFKPLPEKEKIAAKKKFGLTAHTMVFAGRLASEKKMDILIRALALAQQSVPDICLALAGHGSAEQDLRKLADKLGVSKKIIFTGTLSAGELAELYNGSEIFTIASTSETQSMTLIQGLASGLPAIGVNYRALPEYIPASVGYLVQKDNPEAMAEKIVSVMTNDRQRKIMGKHAAEYAHNFSPKTIGQTWVTLYEKTAQEFDKTKPFLSPQLKKKTIIWSVEAVLSACIIAIYTFFFVIKLFPHSVYASNVLTQPTLKAKLAYTYTYLLEENDNKNEVSPSK